MKNIIISFVFALTLISGTVLLNCMFPAEAVAYVNSNDLSCDNNQMCDMVFDAEGNLISETVYRWDEKNNVRGAVISRTVCVGSTSTLAYKK